MSVRKFKIYFATKNKHKFEEAQQILANYDIELALFSKGKVVEIQSDDLKEIAYKAIRHMSRYYKVPLMIEDSGLFIDALNGFPGPYSAYVLRTLGNSGILKLLKGISERRARYMAVVAFSYKGKIELFTGETAGQISYEPRGTGGFGYDPIFIPEEGDGRTFAEMPVGEKNKISHRARALKKLAAYLTRNLSEGIYSVM